MLKTGLEVIMPEPGSLYIYVVTDMISIYRKKTIFNSANMMPILSISAIYQSRYFWYIDSTLTSVKLKFLI